MTLEDLLKSYTKKYNIIDIINLDDWYSFDPFERSSWLRRKIESIYQAEYQLQDRILFTLTQKDEYVNPNDSAGVILTTLQQCLNQVDISNFFVVIITADSKHTKEAQEYLTIHNSDSVPIVYEYFENTDNDQSKRITTSSANLGYNYNSLKPNKINIEDLTLKQKELLFNNKNFCMYPWTHMYVEPSGGVHPCCGSRYAQEYQLGHTNKSSLREIWNSQSIKNLRLNMLNDQPSLHCTRCYEQEKSGFFSMRNSANKHHGHHINKVDNTLEDGTVEDFQMIYWDVRFSNLCNLRCRSCGPMFSSQWYQDQLKLAPDYAKNHKALIFAGKFETDLWNQLFEHIDYVEQIYFAGGEPILMDEHYRILEELERRGKFNVRLIYNTNFTEIKLKDRTVFDYWKKFDSVSVGASLDGMDAHGEYIRKGTVWADVEHNRQQMMKVCPNVDFYVSATLSILNAWHLPDFHRDWVQKGYIKPQDFNVNILTDPKHYRIDIAPEFYKKQLYDKYTQHLAWLSPQDQLRRASNGFQSALTFLSATDNTKLIPTFWSKTDQLDVIRNESLLDAIPELLALK